MMCIACICPTRRLCKSFTISVNTCTRGPPADIVYRCGVFNSSKHHLWYMDMLIISCFLFITVLYNSISLYYHSQVCHGAEQSCRTADFKKAQTFETCFSSPSYKRLHVIMAFLLLFSILVSSLSAVLLVFKLNSAFPWITYKWVAFSRYFNTGSSDLHVNFFSIKDLVCILKGNILSPENSLCKNSILIIEIYIQSSMFQQTQYGTGHAWKFMLFTFNIFIFSADFDEHNAFVAFEAFKIYEPAFQNI